MRAQSQFNVPLVTAAFTILSDVQGVQHTFHETIRRNFPGALMSTNWGDGFLTLANANRPAADDEMLEGVQVLLLLLLHLLLLLLLYCYYYYYSSIHSSAYYRTLRQNLIPYTKSDTVPTTSTATTATTTGGGL